MDSDEIFVSLSALRRSLVAESRIPKEFKGNFRNLAAVFKNAPSKAEILNRIENVILRILEDVASDKPPSLAFPSTESWTDVRFDQELGIMMCEDSRMKSVKFESLASVKKFSLMVKVLSIIYRLVKTERYCTKRDIYYHDPDLFGSQRVLDQIVDNLSCMLHVPRWDLHILATSKGCVAGDLSFQDADNNFIDCRHTKMVTHFLFEEGVQVPNNVKGMHSLITTANFVLVIEKDATFQKVLEARLHEKLHPCILITGKGFPDMNTRMMLRKLWDQFAIPVLVLVDADPHGIEIMAVYKFGSRALSFETENLAVPSLKWLGLLPSDINRLAIPEQSRLTLSKGDVSKAEELKKRPYIDHFPLWRKEIETILSMQQKAEIQALDSITDTFLCDVYIPNKIRCAGWI